MISRFRSRNWRGKAKHKFLSCDRFSGHVEMAHCDGLLKLGRFLQQRRSQCSSLLVQNRFVTPQSEFVPGPAPFLEWIETEKLVVDASYQREIGRRGAINVNQIAENFDWSKFAPVIVAPVEGGSSLLLMVSIGRRPRCCAVRRLCLAKLFRLTAHGRRRHMPPSTAILPRRLHSNSITQGSLLKILRHCAAEVCAAAEVEIVRQIQPNLKRGQTSAVGALTRCFNLYGRDTLITALQCITQTADGNPGFVKATIVEALCEVLNGVPEWRDAGELLLRTMDKFRFADVWGEIADGRDKIFPGTANKVMADKIRKFLSRKLGAPNGRAAA